ncbi:zinc ribbon domain-containing protein [Schaalia canis]|uniref:Zinc ribbon domain-containing protein n=1 Tax=Schaalia canis TaxID=100469 RepID=A0A3P1SFS4_9ACTO|nr:zinc ribbon domain-containing protein [Schaalia canis]RRC95595.1 zinc ribbon domain-containing protein [Schaalia canis]
MREEHGQTSSPYEANAPKQYDVQPWRKVVYYLGGAMVILGVVLFASVFFTFSTVFFRGPNLGAANDLLGGIGFGSFPLSFAGIFLVGLGRILQSVGRQGLAGSGIILSPQQEVDDAEPWNRAEGAQKQDQLEETPLMRDALTRMGTSQEIIKVRCRNCGELDSEDARYCSTCGQPMA